MIKIINDEVAAEGKEVEEQKNLSLKNKRMLPSVKVSIQYLFVNAHTIKPTGPQVRQPELVMNELLTVFSNIHI